MLSPELIRDAGIPWNQETDRSGAPLRSQGHPPFVRLHLRHHSRSDQIGRRCDSPDPGAGPQYGSRPPEARFRRASLFLRRRRCAKSLGEWSPDAVFAEVKRLAGLFPTGLIISPSHEAILPDTPPANIEAIFRGHPFVMTCPSMKLDIP